MNLKTTLARITGILTALEYSSNEPVFAGVNVFVDGQRDRPVWRPPEARITVGPQRPYGTHGNRLKLVGLELECAVAVQDVGGEQAIIDGHRVADATNGAGIESMMALVLPVVRLIDTTAAGAHTTWTRMVDAGDPPFFDGYLTKQVLRLESLCEVI